MEERKKHGKLRYGILGFCSGILNGLFGAGGGVLVVPCLEAFGHPSKKAHATSIAIILPASLISTVLYGLRGALDLPTALSYLPGGLIGAGIGAFLLPKINNRWLKAFFALLIIAGALRILL